MSKLDLTGFGSVFDLIGSVANKIWPDPLERAKNQLALAQLAQAGEFKAIDADLEAMRQQSAINLADAQSNNWFQSGWRPFIGWVCGSACAWNWVGLSLAKFGLALAGSPIVLQAASLEEMLPVLLGLLGLGGFRTYEKLKGVTK